MGTRPRRAYQFGIGSGTGRLCDRSSSEAFAIPQRDCDPVTERIQKIVFSFVVLVADPKAFDLVDQVIARFTLVNCGLVEGVVGVFDAPPVDVARNREGSLVFAHGSQFRINGG
jgi:hypothetical protein